MGMRTLLQISAGRGPGECEIAVAGVAARLLDDAARAGIPARRIAETPGAHGPRSCILALDGEAGRRAAEAAQGTLLWIHPSPLRPGHGRKRWFLDAALLLEPSAGDVKIRPDDLEISRFRASGPGGQHVNTTDSAVRVLHRPTGITAVAREERSQHRNQALAVARIAEALAARAAAEAAAARAGARTRHDAITRGAPRRTFLGADFRPA